MAARKSTKVTTTNTTNNVRTDKNTTTTRGAGLDVVALAANAQVVDAMPATARHSSKGTNPFTALILASIEDGKPRQLEPVSEAQVKSLTYSIRGAAFRAKLGVSIAKEENGDGTVTFTIKGRAK